MDLVAFGRRSGTTSSVLLFFPAEGRSVIRSVRVCRIGRAVFGVEDFVEVCVICAHVEVKLKLKLNVVLFVFVLKKKLEVVLIVSAVVLKLVMFLVESVLRSLC